MRSQGGQSSDIDGTAPLLVSAPPARPEFIFPSDVPSSQETERALDLLGSEGGDTVWPCLSRRLPLTAPRDASGSHGATGRLPDLLASSDISTACSGFSWQFTITAILVASRRGERTFRVGASSPRALDAVPAGPVKPPSASPIFSQSAIHIAAKSQVPALSNRLIPGQSGTGDFASDTATSAPARMVETAPRSSAAIIGSLAAAAVLLLALTIFILLLVWRRRRDIGSNDEFEMVYETETDHRMDETDPDGMDFDDCITSKGAQDDDTAIWLRVNRMDGF
jgi:hypothetical protein